jgi:hypothetical protein
MVPRQDYSILERNLVPYLPCSAFSAEKHPPSKNILIEHTHPSHDTTRQPANHQNLPLPGQRAHQGRQALQAVSIEEEIQRPRWRAAPPVQGWGAPNERSEFGECLRGMRTQRRGCFSIETTARSWRFRRCRCCRLDCSRREFGRQLAAVRRCYCRRRRLQRRHPWAPDRTLRATRSKPRARPR